MCNTDLIVFGARLLACIGYGFAALCLAVAAGAALRGIFLKQDRAGRKVDMDAFGACLLMAFVTTLVTIGCLKILG